MQLPFFIARRYLFAKKSHNVINIISLISAIGIAIGTAALVVVMSVYNGFENLVADIYSKMEADLVIEPSRGKYFSTSSNAFNQIKKYPGVEAFLSVVEENVFITYGDAQGVATIKGVDSTYMAVHHMDENIWEGNTRLYFGEIAQAVVGRTLATELGINIRFVDPIGIYFPKRNENISIVNPLLSLNSKSLFPSGIVSINQDTDKKILFIPYSIASSLVELSKDEVSYVEIVSSQGSDIKRMKKEFSQILGEDFILKDRYQQNETVYRMMNSEKVAIYIILLFIIVVVSFNVFGSLTMLIIEKKNDISIFKTMGGKLTFIKRIFFYEGWLITLWGNFIGVAVGVGLCIIQQQLGIIKMPGNFIITDYPVIIQPLDVILTFTLVGIIGFFITSIPAWKALPSIYNQTDSEEIN